MDPAARLAIPGGGLIALGLVVFVLMVAFPERLKVPGPVGYVVAATFVLAGCLALANVFPGRRVRNWLAVALLSCMVLPSVWIAAGPGERSCSVGLDRLFHMATGTACRAAFGVGAVLGLVLVMIAVRHALQREER